MSSLTMSPAIKPALPVASAVVPVVPDSAPFTPAQRAWLNGFLAGMLGGHVASAPQPGAPDATSQKPAASEAETPQEEEFPWHDPALAMEDRMKLVEGRPHERRLMAAMAQLDCGACGYLCKTYAEAIACGDEKDLTRCTPGGRDTARMLKNI